MKALMIGWELPPYHTGGLGVACAQLCKQLSTEGVDIEFMLPYKAKTHCTKFMNVHAASEFTPGNLDRSASSYDSRRFEPMTLGQDFDAKSPGMLSIAELESVYHKNAASTAQKLEFDIIHAHDWLTLRAAIEVKKACGRPLITHIHATEYDRAGGKEGNLAIHQIEKQGLEMSDKIIAVSANTRQTIIDEYGIDPAKVTVERNGIEPTANQNHTDAEENSYKYLVAMKELGYKVVGNYGRMTIMKNLHILIRAFAAVLPYRPKTLLVLIGGGDQREELIEYAASLGVSRNVLFVDFQTGKRLSDSLDVFDLFVMPSLREPFGLTPLEAAERHVPTLVTYQCGVAEFFHNCLKVDFWDLDMMATKMFESLSSPAMADEITAKAAVEIESLDWQQPARNIKSHYAAVTGARI